MGGGVMAPALWEPPPPPGGVEVVDPGLAFDDDLVPGHYDARPARPLAQFAMRAALWTAVAVGCLGGVVGLVREPGGGDGGPVTVTPSISSIPGPVADTAKLVVGEWLTATGDDEQDAALLAMFVDPPTLRGTSGLVSVDRLTAVAGQRMTDGYWSVTVAAQVTETVPVEGSGTTPTGADDAAAGDTTLVAPAADQGDGAADAPGDETQAAEIRTATWYLQVGIVGDVTSGLSALTAPAVVPPPPPAPDGWRSTTESFEAATADDPVAKAVGGFLNALLAGDGDPSRYQAAGHEMKAADPAPFTGIELLEMSVLPLEQGKLRVIAWVAGTSQGGARRYYSYELMLAERVDRWEITGFSGAPTLVVQPPEQAPAGGAGAGG
jgi:hypothetical protein